MGDKRSSDALCVSRVPKEQVDDVNLVSGVARILLTLRRCYTAVDTEKGLCVLSLLHEFHKFLDTKSNDNEQSCHFERISRAI